MYIKLFLNSINTFPHLWDMLEYWTSKWVNVYIAHYKLKGDVANSNEG
jgi:hypothetical protein